MTTLVKVVRGFLSDGTEIGNVVLPLVSQIERKSGVAGTKYRGVFNSSEVKSFPSRRINLRVFFKSDTDFSFVGQTLPSGISSSTENEFIPQGDTRTDEEIIHEMNEKFEVINILTNAIAKSKSVRSLVVSGSPGTGKSFTVMDEIEKFEKVPNFYHVVLKGSISPIKLYTTLWECRSPNNVVILDDCDAVVEDIETLNMIKAATDSSKTRKISYNKLSSYLEANDIPNSFEFEGGVIYLSNINFANEVERKTKLAPHVEAFVSRSLYINVTMETKREKILRVTSVISSEQFKQVHHLNSQQASTLIQWLKENENELIEISIRTAVKLGNLIKDFPSRWEKIAKVTLCK